MSTSKITQKATSSLWHKTSCIALAVAMLGAVTISSATDAEARERSRSGSYTTAKGSMGTFSKKSSHKKGEGYSNDKNVTTSKGKTYGRTTTGKYDKDTKTMNKNTTGYGGKSYETATSYDKDAKAYTKTATGGNGKTVTSTGTASNGQRSGTWETGDGKTGSYDSQVSRSAGSVNKSHSVTTAGGKTYNSESSYQHDKDTNTITGSHTNYKGKTRDGSVTYELNK
jgi:hypothetical protein